MVEERFWAKVNKTDSCWLWTASGARYGHFYPNGKKLALAHRFSWEITFGPIPDGLHVMHKCDVGRCVNPAHLTLGTHQENIKDRDNKGRQRSPKGQDSPHAKLLNADVIEIRKRFAAGETQSHLAREFGVTPAAIYYIVNRKTYKHI